MSKCCFCGKEIKHKINGNDPRPIVIKDDKMPICCNQCNERIVIPTRQSENELKNQLALTEKALELACDDIWAMSIWENTKEEVIEDSIEFYKQKAKTILFYTEKPLATGGVIKQSTLDKITQDINKGDEK